MPVLAITHVGKYYRTAVLREVRNVLELKENCEIECIPESNNKIVIKKSGVQYG